MPQTFLWANIHLLAKTISSCKDFEIIELLHYITLSLDENLLYLGSSLINFFISFQELVNVTSPVSSNSSLKHDQVKYLQLWRNIENAQHIHAAVEDWKSTNFNLRCFQKNSPTPLQLLLALVHLSGKLFLFVSTFHSIATCTYNQNLRWMKLRS